MIYLILVAAIVGAFIAALFNSLIKLKNKCEEAFADIDTQLKRRYDLIPNLVETVKGYASHESGTLEKVVQARNTAMNAQTLADKEQAENMITGALKTIFALAEQYPDLKANQNFLDLQKNLSEIEEHLQMSRRYYNGTVRDFNTKLQTFPNNLLAKNILKFDDKPFFMATEEEKQNVKVDFAKTAEPATPAAPKTATPEPAPAPQAPATPEPPKPEENPPTPPAAPPQA